MMLLSDEVWESVKGRAVKEVVVSSVGSAGTGALCHTKQKVRYVLIRRARKRKLKLT